MTDAVRHMTSAILSCVMEKDKDCPYRDNCHTPGTSGHHYVRQCRAAELVPDPVLPASQFFVQKTFEDYPCAHRQWQHEGHCSRVHGYSRSFTFMFRPRELDERGWVIDFGDLKWLRQHLDQHFDHTLLVASDDPLLEQFAHLDAAGGCRLVILPYGPSMEGTARYLCEYADAEVMSRTQGRVRCIGVQAKENDKNSAVFYNPILR